MFVRRLLPALLFFLLALPSFALAEVATPKDVAADYYKSIVNERDFERIADFVHAHFKDHHASRLGQEHGRAGLEEELGALAKAFPDYRVTVQEVISEGETVATRLTFMGTHEGEFMGLEPTGEKVVMRGVEMLRIREGTITERFGNYDLHGLKEQLAAKQPDPTT